MEQNLFEEKVFEVNYTKVKKLQDLIVIVKAFGYNVAWKHNTQVPDQFKEIYEKGFLRRIK